MVYKSVSKQTIRAKCCGANKQAKFYGYDLVLLIDVKTRCCTKLGGNMRVPADMYQKHPVHKEALEETLKRGVYNYEWIASQQATPGIYQTTCIVCPSEDGLPPAGVLSFSQDITHGLVPAVPKRYIFHEGSNPRTFAQILLASRETEKREISKALHDEIGSSAVMLTSLLSLVRASVQVGDKKQALKDLEQLDTQVKQTIEHIKDVIVSLRPPSLENKGGLVGAVRDLLEHVGKLSQIQCMFENDDVEEKGTLSENIKILLYRVVQEALTNTIKHAHAQRIFVSLKQINSQIRLVVKDDGVGFKPRRQLSIDHVGLLAMKDGVKLLGGTINIKSAPGKGTRIEVTCPRVVYGG